MTLKDTLRDNALKYWHNENVFSQEIKLIRRDGLALIRHATLEIEQDVVYADSDGTISFIDRLMVMCSRDPDKGISTLDRLDRVVVPDDFYPATTELGRTFEFFGEFKDRLLNTWVPVFERKSRKTVSA